MRRVRGFYETFSISGDRIHLHCDPASSTVWLKVADLAAVLFDGNRCHEVTDTICPLGSHTLEQIATPPPPPPPMRVRIHMHIRTYVYVHPQ